MILPVLIVAAVLFFLALLAILLACLVTGAISGCLAGGLLAGYQTARRPKMASGWKTAIVMLGTICGGFLGAAVAVGAALAALYFTAQ